MQECQDETDPNKKESNKERKEEIIKEMEGNKKRRSNK